MRALEREVSEEIEVERVVSLTPLGVINEEGDEVSRVHLGFLFRMEVAGEVRVRETEKLAGLWLRIKDLPAFSDELEGWSRVATDALCERESIFSPADILLPREGDGYGQNGPASPATSSRASRSTGRRPSALPAARRAH